VRELLIVLFCLIAVGALEGMRQLLRWSKDRRRGELQRRLQSVVGDAGAGAGASATLLRKGKYATNPLLDRLLRNVPLAVHAEKLLEQADSRLTVAQLFGATALFACAGIAAGAVLRLGLLIGALLAVAAMVMPYLLLVLARVKRSEKLSEQLPEALEMMSRSLRAGHALTSAFEVVATEMPEPVSIEFGRAFESQRLGLPVDQAIVQMTHRAPGNRDLKIFAVSTVIQRETGGNLAEILGNIAETIRARYRFYGKLRALTAEGRASAVILGALPIVVAVVLRIVNPDYFLVLLTPTGKLILAFSIVVWLVGVVWLVSLTKVDI
jgi:tight adherence protein B